MKKKSSIKYLIAFISVGFLIPLGISLACGYSDMDDSDVISFFSPEVIISESFKPFFRSINPFYSIRFKEDNIKDFDQKNIEDWYSYFSNQVNKPDLSQLLYKTRIGQIDTLIRASFNKKTEVPFFLRRDTDKSVVKKYQIISKSGSINYIAQDTVPLIPDCLKGNSILSYLDKSKTIDFLNYLVFAKKCEPVSAVRTYFWYDQKDEEKAFKARRKILIRGLITEAGNLIPKIKRPDIKQRYLFQYERLYFFEGSYDTCLTVYLNNENQFIDSSAIKYRAMSYAAGALKRQHKTGYANYLYSVVYDNCDELKITAESGYSPGDETDWSLSLSMAKNVREKTVLWHMLGIKFDPVRAMKEIFSVDPSSNLLDLLLVRAVNIQEESVLPQDIHSTSSESKFLFRSENLDQELVKIVKTAADSKNTGNSFLWNLSAGYLAILSNDAANAVKYLRMAENMSLKDSLLFNQVKLASVIWKLIRLNLSILQLKTR